MLVVQIALEPELTTEEFIDVLVRSTLHWRRPVGDTARVEAMLRNASIIATARRGQGELVGVARAISDFAYCTYLSDLAVDQAVQRQGIGKQLLDFVRQTAGPQSSLILLAAPAAVEYYPKLGMQAHPACWMWPAASDSLKR
jgi:GNAT superfamily N-acetyltransferase